ncbi:hypothetical protein Esti_001418 [Eimeria stiedai]
MKSTRLALRLQGWRAAVFLVGGPPKPTFRGPPELAVKPAAQQEARFAGGSSVLPGCSFQRVGGASRSSSLAHQLGAPSARSKEAPNAAFLHASLCSNSSSSSGGGVLMLRFSPWTHRAGLVSWSSLQQQQQQQQRRGFAAASTAAKKRRKLLRHRRRNWRPPKVPQKYLREETDAVAPKTSRLGNAKPRHKERGPYKVEDLGSFGGLGAPSGEEASVLRFVGRQKKPHEVSSCSPPWRHRCPWCVQQQRRQGALLPLSETLPSLQRTDLKEETEGPSPALSLGRAQGRFSVRGAYAATERDYFRRFFRDRDRALDGQPQQQQQQHEHKQEQGQLHKRRYIPPKEYWYAGEHEPPTALMASALGARDLKFVLMREARRIRLGGAADLSVWGALEARAAAIWRDTANVSARTILRMLQAFASVQLPMQPRHVEACMQAIVTRQAEMRPENYVHLFQALARLRLKHRICLLGLQEMMLSWAVLRNNFLIKAANSLSKLGLGSHVCVTPLKLVLAVRIPTFTAQNCRLVKWVTGATLFSSAMLVDFLNCAAKQQKAYLLQRRPRDLQLMELYLRLQKPEVYEQLEIETQYFLEVIRNASTATFSDSSDEEEEAGSVLGRPPLWAVCTPRDDVAQRLQQQQQQHSGTRRPEAALREQMQAEAFYTPIEAADKHQQQQQQQESEEEAAVEKDQQQQQQQAKASYSSALHADISRTLSLMGVPHVNAALAGPSKADIYLPRAQVVIEAVAGFQFYANTQTLTTMSKLRHELFAGMGFQVLLIHQRQWLQLDSDEAKMELLRHLLPPSVFPSQPSKCGFAI